MHIIRLPGHGQELTRKFNSTIESDNFSCATAVLTFLSPDTPDSLTLRALYRSSNNAALLGDMIALEWWQQEQALALVEGLPKNLNPSSFFWQLFQRAQYDPQWPYIFAGGAIYTKHIDNYGNGHVVGVLPPTKSAGRKKITIIDTMSKKPIRKVPISWLDRMVTPCENLYKLSYFDDQRLYRGFGLHLLPISVYACKSYFHHLNRTYEETINLYDKVRHHES